MVRLFHDLVIVSHDLILVSHDRLTTFPTEHDYYKKKLSVSEEVGVSLISCDNM